MMNEKKMIKKYGFKKPNLEKSKNQIPYEADVFMICDYCKKTFAIKFKNYRKRLKRRVSNFDKDSCFNKKCIDKRKSEVGKIAVATNKRKGNFKKEGEKRKGKTFEDYFGKEIAKKAKKKISKARLKQKDPRKGTVHSEDSKKLMSKKRKEFYEKGEKIYKSIITDEMVDCKTHQSEVQTKLWQELSTKEKNKRIEKALLARLAVPPSKKTSDVGSLNYWYSGEPVYYESSYEQMYFKELNSKKKFWKKNISLLISKHNKVKGYNDYYVPDVLLFEDSKFKNLKTIAEVKPSEFLYNPENKKWNYYKRTENRKKYLIEYCKKNNLDYKFITEAELNSNYIKSNSGASDFKRRKEKAENG